jgi:hypothetical protein
MTALVDTDRLVKLCGMLGSDYAGERAAAAAKADALVRAHGLTWHDVIAAPAASPAPASDWLRMAAYCQVHADRLSPREFEFVCSIIKWRRVPTSRQWNWLADLYARVYSEARR